MAHLRWQIENILTYRSDDNSSSERHTVPVGAAITRSKGTTADVWISPSQVWYRIEGISLNEQYGLETFVREIKLAENYAVLQDYNCRPQNSGKALDVCFINVIPVFGNSLASDINLLQFPSDNFWTRSLMSGQMPTSCDGIPVRSDGSEVVFQNFESGSGKVLTPAVKTPLLCKATYSGGQLSSVTQLNGFNSAPLISYKDIKWDKGHIVSFSYNEESIQASELKRPRLEMKFKLAAIDDQPCPLKIATGAKVLDYRLCAPVALNDFPDQSCPPKTYTYVNGLAAIPNLSTAREAMFPPEAPRSNSAPAWIWVVSIGAAVLGLVILARVMRKTAARVLDQA